MKVGDRVVYGGDPLLYGVMEITRLLSGGRVECRSAFRSAAWPRNLFEVFDGVELEPEGFDAGVPVDEDAPSPSIEPPAADGMGDA